jgi:signal peptide peptidase SppA
LSFQSLDLPSHLADIDKHRQAALDAISEYLLAIVDGIAVIAINGPMMKHASSFSSSVSTVEIRRLLHALEHDPAILGIILRIESPGGTVSGTKELADDIARINERKPIVAFCEDLTASAAYWVASQAGTIYANPTALVGSIGTYCVVMDSSGMAEKEGVKVHVVRAGDYKGMGQPGTVVTDAHIAELQKQVDGLNTFFLDAVSRGRELEGDKLTSIADGRVFLASEAKDLGLVDEVMTFEEAFQAFELKVAPMRLTNPNYLAREDRPVLARDLDHITGNALGFHYRNELNEMKLSCIRDGVFVLDAVAKCEAFALDHMTAKRDDLTAMGFDQAQQLSMLRSIVTIAEAKRIAKEKGVRPLATLPKRFG